MMDSVGQSVELAALFFLMPHIIGKIGKGMVAWDAMFTAQLILVSVFIVGVLGPVSYTHLDVYKRQMLNMLSQWF